MLSVMLAWGASLGTSALAVEDPEASVSPMHRWGAGAALSETSVAAGSSVRLRVAVKTAPMWHVYALQQDAGEDTYYTRFELDDLPTGVSVREGARWSGPDPKPYVSFGEEIKVYSGSSIFEIPLTVSDRIAPGTYSIGGSVGAMACDASTCMPPATVAFQVSLEVIGGGAPAPKVRVAPDLQWGAAATLVPSEAAPGSTVKLQVHAKTAPKWHLYSLKKEGDSTYPTRLELGELPQGLEFIEGADWNGPKPKDFDSFGDMVKVYEGEIVFELPLRVSKDAAAGERSVSPEIHGLACTDTTCMRPGSVKTKATLTIAAAEAESSGASESESVSPDATDDASGAIVSTPSEPTSSNNAKGLLGLALFALGGAVVSWVMPCVYPMIPITISFFGKMAEDKRAGRVAIATSYGLGITGTFLLTGLIVGLLSLGVADVAERSEYAQLGNVIATNPWLNLVIGLLFIGFALSMFGLFEIKVPSWLITKTDSAGRSSKSAHLGSFMLGVTFALASFTCTVPVVGFLLGNAASGTADGLFRSLYGMLIYGAAFAAPFVALSLFPGALSNLPKAGGWMETVKVGFGFLELGVAIKFLWVPDMDWGVGVLTRPVVLALFLVVGAATLAFFLGFLNIGHGNRPKPFRVGVGRWATSLLTVLILAPVALSLATPPTYHYPKLPEWVTTGLEALIPPAPGEDDLARAEGWFIDDYQNALAAARDADKPLLIDFTGDYCANCRAMERTVFKRDDVKEQFEEMVLTRLYTDRPKEKNKEFYQMQLERYGLASLPYYVILDPKDESTLAEAGGYIPNRFPEMLGEALAKFETGRTQ